MSKINFDAVFNRKNKLNKKGMALVHIRANQNGKSIYFSTDISLKPEAWNKYKKEIRNSHPHYITLNRKIADLKNSLMDLENKLLSKTKVVTLKMLKEQFENINSFDNSFTEFYENDLNKNAHKFKSWQNDIQTLNKLKKFQKNISFEDLNYIFLTEFANHLENSSLHQNTVHRHIKNIRKYVNKAIKLDLIEYGKNPFIKFKYTAIETERKYLSTLEFIKLVNFTLPPEHSKLQLAFDMYLIALYTGMRISDIKDIEKNQLKPTIDNGYIIDKKIVKTGKKIEIPIDVLFDAIDIDVPQENTPITILKRNSNQSENDKIFSYIETKTSYNHLRKIFELVDIKYKPFHAARHTIAMYLLNDKGASTEVVGKLLGHTDIKTTQIYARMNNKGLTNQLRIIANKNKTNIELKKQTM